MEEFTINLTPQALALIPVVAAIIQAAKKIPRVQQINNWLPFISVGLALALGYAIKIPNPILPSIIIGLVASGGYDLLKGKK